jgi:hypothetical protein
MAVKKVRMMRTVEMTAKRISLISVMGVAAVAAAGAPFQTGIDRGAAGVDLERIGEHDKDDDGETADRRGGSRGVHADDVARDVIAVGEISGNARQNVESTSGPYAAEDDGCGSEVRIVRDLIQNGKHL